MHDWSQCYKFVEKFTIWIKKYVKVRPKPFTIIFSSMIFNIEEAIKILNMIEEDNFLNQKLKIQF